MLKPRLIPVLLLKNGILVRSRTFGLHQSTGDPIGQVERYTAWKADELVYLDISRDEIHDFRHTASVIGSTSSKKNIPATMTDSIVEIIGYVSERCFVPLTVGGKIRTLEDIRVRLKVGADKVSINTKAIEDPEFVKSAAMKFGSQCIVICVDVKYDGKTDKYEVYTRFGKEPTGLHPVEWCLELEKRGAGEILLQSIDRDGTGVGYDLDLIRMVSTTVNIPVIALGGVGKFEHFGEGLNVGKATALAAANIFHFTEHSIIKAKKYMVSEGFDIRL